MLDKLQVEFVSRLEDTDPSRRFSYASESMRNPAANYVDPARFDAEYQALFRDRPLFIGLSSECADRGSYLARDLGGIPIIVLRQKDGSLRAFVNICRHRGARLLNGDGNRGARGIICPYHAWTFDQAGELLNRPNSHGSFDDVVGDCNLIQRAVGEAHGLIFVNPSSLEPFDVEDMLHGMQNEFGNYDVLNAHHLETRVTVWNMNWKLLMDTFLEAYHVPYVHQETIDPVFLPNQLFDGFGPLPRFIGLRRSILNQIKEKPREEWRLFPHASANYLLVPNALFVYQGDHIETWRFEPIDADNTRAFTSIFSPGPPLTEKAMTYWKKNLEVLCKVAMTEDFPIQAQIHQNLKTGAMSEVIYGRNEPALIYFHKAVNAAVEVWQTKNGAIGT